MILDVDGFSIQFGKSFVDKINSYDNELKALADEIVQEGHVLNVEPFATNYLAALQACINVQEDRKAVLESIARLVHTRSFPG